jgi:hypothetical protein
MLYRKIPPVLKIQDKLTGSRSQGAVAGKNVEYFSVFFFNAKNLASVYCPPIRALASAFRIKNSPVKHGGFFIAIGPKLI